MSRASVSFRFRLSQHLLLCVESYKSVDDGIETQADKAENEPFSRLIDPTID